MGGGQFKNDGGNTIYFAVLLKQEIYWYWFTVIYY